MPPKYHHIFIFGCLCTLEFFQYISGSKNCQRAKLGQDVMGNVMTEQRRIEAMPSPSEAAFLLGRRQFLALLGGGLIAAATGARAADVLPEVRLGILRFGTAQWLWVSRQREAGADFTFRPLSSSLGALVTGKDSTIKSVADLKGKRLGVAGTPLDKSWALLRVYARSRFGLDLDKETSHNFGPPPLLQHALDAGQLDAVLTFWPFAARAEADGQRIVVTMDQVLSDLGFTTTVPFVGYVFSAGWAAANADTLKRFLAATDKARAVLDHDDAAWDTLQAISGAKTPTQLADLRHWYRAGHPPAWTSKDVAAAGRVYELLRSMGGPGLVGKSKNIVDGTFWHAPA